MKVKRREEKIHGRREVKEKIKRGGREGGRERKEGRKKEIGRGREKNEFFQY